MNTELGAAIARMDAALDQIETAVARHFDTDGRRSALEIELQVMGDDRARLATELDSATARLARLEMASDHVGPRLEAAIGSIRFILDRAEATPDVDASFAR